MTNKVTSVFESKEYLSALAVYNRLKRCFGKSVFIITSPESCGDAVCGLQFGNVVRILFERPRTVRVQYSVGGNSGKFFDIDRKAHEKVSCDFGTDEIVFTVVRYALFLGISGAKESDIGITVYDDFEQPERYSYAFNEGSTREEFINMMISKMRGSNMIYRAYVDRRSILDFAEALQGIQGLDEFKVAIINTYNVTHVYDSAERFRLHSPLNRDFFAVPCGTPYSYSARYVGIRAIDADGDECFFRAFTMRRNANNSSLFHIESIYLTNEKVEDSCIKIDIRRQIDFYESVMEKVSDLSGYVDLYDHPMFAALDDLYEETKADWVVGECDTHAYIPTGFSGKNHDGDCTVECFAAVFGKLKERQVKSIEILDVPCSIVPKTGDIPLPGTLMKETCIPMLKINFIN